ncbi:MAG: TonB-dependent receptor [Gemmatimonadaceae bacterium]|nr:TonB-dependent receptor [Gemmatimonadaceae bacterium]
MPQPPRLLVALSLLGLAPATVHAQQTPGQTLVAQYSAVATTRVMERPARPERPAGIVRGRVVVEGTGAAVGNAQVQMGTRGAQSNDAGVFAFANVPAGTYTVQVRMIGFERFTRAVTVVDNQTTDLTITLKRQSLSLDQIVVTGTPGAARRREVGNAISQIDVTSLPEVPASVDNLLQGKATGLTVTGNSGGVGGGASIRLRGNVSATQSNQPLIYVDGVRVKSNGFPKNTFPTGYAGNSDNTVYSPLNDIDPSDIDRIEVIKGPAATTLYGTEAASGVIQIFTKRGQAGASRWTFQTDQSMSQTPKFGPTRGFEGKDLVIPDKEINPYGTVDYLYLDPWLRTGYKHKYVLSLDGGRDDAKYYVSGATSNETGVLPLDKANQSSVRGNLSVMPRKDLTVQWNTSFSTNNLTKTPAGGTAAGLTLNASRRDRNYFGSADPAQIGRVLDFQLTSRIDHLVTGGTFQYQPKENFSTRLILGYDLAAQETRNYMPYGFATVPKGQISDGRYSSRTTTADYAATWSHALFRDLRSSLSGGAQAVAVDQVNVAAGSRDFPGPGEQTVSNGALSLGVEDRSRVINAGLFVQDVLDYKNRYFLTLGARFDGNSAFGQSLGLQMYPKVSGSYVVSDESFWPKNLGTMKLRSAYGQSGRAPGAFDAVRTWSSYSWGGVAAFIPRNLGNDELGPERTSEIEAGFETSTLGGRLNVDFTWYQRTTKDALFAVSQAPSEGLWASQLENVGKLRSDGVELGVNATLIQRPHFGWDAGFTYSTNHSKVLSLGGAAPFTIGNNGWVAEGSPVPVIRGFCVANPTEFAAPVRQANCDSGPNTPTRTITGTSSFTLPGDFSLSTRGEYQGGAFAYSLLDGEAIVRGIRWPSCFNAYPAIDSGDLSSVPASIRARCMSAYANRDYAIFPLDFFRLRDLTLRRSFPLKMGGASSAQVSVSGQNLFWWKKAKDSLIDPETSGGFNNQSGMAQQVRSVGGSIPIPRTFLMSVRLTY